VSSLGEKRFFFCKEISVRWPIIWPRLNWAGILLSHLVTVAFMQLTNMAAFSRAGEQSCFAAY